MKDYEQGRRKAWEWASKNKLDPYSMGRAYAEGYHQAERDNELTLGDIREIYCITLNLREHLGASVFGEPLYQEVLKRFKNYKERNYEKERD